MQMMYRAWMMPGRYCWRWVSSLGERGGRVSGFGLGCFFGLGFSETAALTPRMVKRMLISRSAPHPRSRKTPSGGRMMAKKILQMSLEGRRWMVSEVPLRREGLEEGGLPCGSGHVGGVVWLVLSGDGYDCGAELVLGSDAGQ